LPAADFGSSSIVSTVTAKPSPNFVPRPGDDGGALGLRDGLRDRQHDRQRLEARLHDAVLAQRRCGRDQPLDVAGGQQRPAPPAIGQAQHVLPPPHHPVQHGKPAPAGAGRAGFRQVADLVADQRHGEVVQRRHHDAPDLAGRARAAVLAQHLQAQPF
jgi:hypothetical protein